MRQPVLQYKGFVFKLIFANAIIFMFQIIGGGSYSSMIEYYALTPALVAERGYVWQLVTYMFLHGNMLHIFFNMYALLIFGIPIEQEWGSRRFLFYYFFTGTGAGLTIFFINFITKGAGYISPTIGASGAVFGLLLAFGVLYPNAELLLFFFLPIKAKYLVFLYGALELYLELSGPASGISHVGHLGGLFFGIVFFLFFRKRSLSFKTKHLKAQILKSMSPGSAKATTETAESGRSTEYKIQILRKLHQSGPDSLTDDEYQFTQYMKIMHGDTAGLCNDADFNIDDPYCERCEHFDACFVRMTSRYIT
jgi:membrane associated rhomboid family serine protease